MNLQNNVGTFMENSLKNKYICTVQIQIEHKVIVTAATVGDARLAAYDVSTEVYPESHTDYVTKIDQVVPIGTESARIETVYDSEVA